MESVWLSSKIAGPSPLPLIHHSATTITGRKIVIIGGPSQGQKLRILNAAGLRAWTDAKATGVGPVPRILHRCMTVPLSSTDEYVFLFGGCTEDESRYFNDAFTLNTRTMTWTCVRVQGALPMPRCGHSQNLSTVNNVLLGWIFGGKYLTKVMNELICVHFTKGNISMTKLDQFKIICDDTSVTELPARTFHTASIVQKENSACLFIIGGKGSKDEVFNDVWEIELPSDQVPTANTEVTCRRINFKGNFLPRYDHACEVIDGGRIVVYGGVGADGRDLNDLLMFDTNEHTWYTCTNTNSSAPGPRHGHAMTVLNKQVYLMGGDTSSSEVYVLQLDKVQWEPLSGTATLTKPRASSRARVTPALVTQADKPKTTSNFKITPNNTNSSSSSLSNNTNVTTSNTNAASSSSTNAVSYEAVPMKTFTPTLITASNNNNNNTNVPDYSDASDSPAIARVPHPGSFKASPNTNAPSASPLSKFSLAPDPGQMLTPPSSPSVPAAVATSGTSATASSPKVATRRSVTSRAAAPTTVTNATAGFGMSPKVPHHPSPNAAKVGSSRASISGARMSFGGSPKSSSSSQRSGSSSNIVLVSNNNNAAEEPKSKSQSDQLKQENERLKQQLEKEAENAKVWRLRAEQTQLQIEINNTNATLESELSTSRQEAAALADRVRALEQELAAVKSVSQNTDAELELISLNAQVNTLKFENTSLKAQLRLASSSAFQGDSSGSNNNTNKALENELSQAKSTIEQKDKEISALRREIDEMKQKSTTNASQEQALRVQLTSALSEVRKLNENTHNASATTSQQLAQLQTQNDVLQSELQQQAKMKRQLMEEIEDMQEAMEQTRSNGEVAKLAAENSQLTSQMISLQNEYQELEITLNKLQASHAELQFAFEQNRVQQQNGTHGQSDGDLVALEQALQQRQLEVQQLTDEVQQWSLAAAQLQVVNEEMVRELQQEIQDLKKELLELSDAYHQEHDRRLRAEEELIAAEAKMTEIEGIFSKFVGGSSSNRQ